VRRDLIMAHYLTITQVSQISMTNCQNSGPSNQGHSHHCLGIMSSVICAPAAQVCRFRSEDQILKSKSRPSC
jgi:hypothetical protein